MVEDRLQAAIEAFRQQNRPEALALLASLLQDDPQHIAAWVWLAAIHPEPDKKRYSLEKVLELAPEHPQAQQAISLLNSSDSPALGAQAVETYLLDELLQNAPGLAQSFPGVSPVAAAAAEIATPPEPSFAPASPEPPLDPAMSPVSAAPAPAAARRPARPPKRRGGCLKAFVILLLSLLVFALLLILVLLVFGGSLLPSATVSVQPVTVAPVDTATPFVLPPTWTNTPTLLPTNTAVLLPTLTPTRPLPSLTPIPTITPGGVSRVIIIGRSVGDKQLRVYRFGSGPRARLVVAGTHGPDESPDPSLAERLIAYLDNNPAAVPAEVTVYIVQSLNPDSASTAPQPNGLWNGHGVDLNRNFDADWKAAWENTGCAIDPGGAGPAPASEPETQALLEFIKTRGIEMLLHYNHSRDGVFPAGDPPSPDAEALAKALAEALNVESGQDNKCPTNGMLTAWAAGYGLLAVDAYPHNAGEKAVRRNIDALNVFLTWVVAAPPILPPTQGTPAATRPYVTPTFLPTFTP